jgi:hypothetical protein
VTQPSDEQVVAATARGRGSDRPKACRRPGLWVAAAALIGGGLILAACGGGSTNPGAAGSNSTTGAAASASSGGAGSRQELSLHYAQCMRSHGVTNYPDPSASGGSSIVVDPGSGVDTNSPTYQAAQQSCQKYLGGSGTSSAEQTQTEAKMLLYTQCMRSHGLPNFPDPVTGPDGAPMFELGPRAGVNLNSPSYQAANSACQDLLGGTNSGG